MEYKITIYESSTGKRPFDKWLKKLTDKKTQAAIDLRIERLRMGNFGACKPLGKMIYELKINVGPGYRIYFGKIGMKVILLLCAGSKKTQQKDIERAREYFLEIKNLKVRI